MKQPIRLLMPLLLSFAAWTVFIQPAAAEDPMTVVNLAGKFTPCGPDLPGCEHILLMGDPKTEPSQHVYRFIKGYAFVKHWHVSAENLVMVRGSLTINSEGGHERAMRVGDYVHIPAQVVHWGICPEECVFYLNVDGPDSFNVVENK